MLRIAIFFTALALLFFIIKRIKEDKNFTKEIVSIMIALLIMIGFHEYFSNKERVKVTNILVAFKEGKTLLCHDAKVNKDSFEYESGTMVFISKKNEDVKYPVLGCVSE